MYREREIQDTYGLMNEKGLTVGESTCAAYIVANATAGNPKEVD